MGYYTLYGVGLDGGIQGAMAVCLPADAEALDFAREQLDENWRSVEVWGPDCLIGTLATAPCGDG